MDVVVDIETVPCEDIGPFLKEAEGSFKAPSSLTKDQAGADLRLDKEEIKFTGKAELIARWEQEMAQEKAPEVAEEMWRKTSFDGTKGRVVSVAWNVGDDFRVVVNDPQGEMITLERFFRELKQSLKHRPPYFIGHRVVFDLKFLFRRAVILGINPGFALPFRGRHGKDYFCTMEGWCEYGEKISMDNLATALGVEGKGDIDGSMVCDLWLNGQYDTIAQYNMDDVRKTKAIYERMTFKEAAAEPAFSAIGREHQS